MMTVMHHHCAACGGRETYPGEIICQLSLTELASLSLVLCAKHWATLCVGVIHQKPHEQMKDEVQSRQESPSLCT